MTKKADLDVLCVEHRKSSDRRADNDRRKQSNPVDVERRKLNRREKVNRRRQIDPTTCERDYSTDEVEFMNAFNEYKRKSGRMFPTCSEILEVVRALGYAKPGQVPASAEPFVPTVDAENPTTTDDEDL